MLKHKHILLAIIVTALFVLSACGADQQAEPAAEQENVQEEQTNKEESTEKEEPVEERVIEHLMGETVIEGEPKKIASLFPYMTDQLLSLGITPIAASAAGPNSDAFSSYIPEELLKDTTNVGWFSEPDLETLLMTEPDLILGLPHLEKAYEQLEKIAPTVLFDKEYTDEGVKDWRSTFEKVASFVGKEEKAQEIIEEYNQKVKKAKEELSKSVGDETVMFLRVRQKELRYYGQKNFDIIYGDLGLQPPPEFPNNESTFQPLSLEKLPEINPDHIFLLIQSEEKYENIKTTPLWENLTAVQKDNVYIVNYDLFMQAFGPIAYEQVIDEVVQNLTK